MKILMIAENDPAGMAIAFTNAINRYTEHTARLITLQTRYNVNFESDLHLPNIADDDFSEVEQLLKDADIIHFHMLFDENRVLGPLLVRDYIQNTALLYHHHGHPDFMANAETYRRRYAESGRCAIVSTPDLLRLLPESTWMPNLVPLYDVQFMPYAGMRADHDVRICQAPTRKFNKDTQMFLDVMEEITREYPRVQRVVVENQSYFDCLRIKRGCDIVFDHMQGHFGISSLESLAQAKAVIAGLDELNVEQIRLFMGTDENPWVIARDRDQLYARLEELIRDPDRRREVGARARQLMEGHWTEQKVVGKLVSVYEELLERTT